MPGIVENSARSVKRGRCGNSGAAEKHGRHSGSPRGHTCANKTYSAVAAMMLSNKPSGLNNAS
ncbi:MAG: hypothetical protein OXU62_12310, partial [Gammaproteobacteria bacterium]|nr:hypothetical protein [Gammaproteobacteria bacterium]